MKKFILLLSAILLITSVSFAQKNVRAGKLQVKKEATFKGTATFKKPVTFVYPITVAGNVFNSFAIKYVDEEPLSFSAPYDNLSASVSSILITSKTRGETCNGIYLDIIWDDRDLVLGIDIKDHPGWDNDSILITYQTDADQSIMTVVTDILGLFGSTEYIYSNFDYSFLGMNPSGTPMVGQSSDFFEPGKPGSMFDQPDLVFIRDTTQPFSDSQYMFIKKDSAWYRFSGCKTYY